MKRRLLPILMTLVLVCALPIWAAFVTSGDVTNPLVSTAWATLPDLQAKIDAAADNATITLDSNTEIAATLQITKNLTLDLNGCVLRMTGNTRVFYVYNNATLTIQDSSAAKSGTITGGNAGDGGGVRNRFGGQHVYGDDDDLFFHASYAGRHLRIGNRPGNCA